MTADSGRGRRAKGSRRAVSLRRATRLRRGYPGWLAGVAVLVGLCVAVVLGVSVSTYPVTVNGLPGADAQVWLGVAVAVVALTLIVGAAGVHRGYAILLAERRGPIALVRTLGASPGQLRRALAGEAAVAGAGGALAGVALGTGLALVLGPATGAAGVLWAALPAGLVFGVLLTLAASWRPIMDATRIPAPAEPYAAPSPMHARGVICAIIGPAGLGLVVAGFARGRADVLPLVLAGSVLLLAAFALSVPFYGPGLLWRAEAVVPGRAAKLAIEDLALDLRHTVAAALVFAIGVVAATQVGLGTTRGYVMERVYQTRPIAVSVTATPEVGVADIPAGVQATLNALPGVVGAVALPGEVVADEGGVTWLALGYTPDVGRVVDPTPVGDDEALINADSWERAGRPSTIVLSGAATKTFGLRLTRLVEPGQVLVSQASLQTLGVAAPNAAVWLLVRDRTKAATVMTLTQQALRNDPRFVATGSVMIAGGIDVVLQVATGVAQAMSAVAVLVALVGGAGLLAFAVRQRSRDAALAHALGLARRRFRTLAIVRALAVAALAGVVGLVVGGLLGALVMTAAAQGLGIETPMFTIDWRWPLALVASVLVAALLASILPWRPVKIASS